MTETENTASERTQTLWGFAIAALVVVLIVAAFLLFGLPGVGMLMVIVTPIVVAILVLLSIGR